ncbi:MAG: hypothetical protein DMG30_14125 [Acidobacteria bacterium]|nr:MAG: hypothetical protein DMG30_14125 [Acidobacteriota bacterium]
MRVPDRGDVVWVTLTPQAGHEQAGRRPAVVLSPAAYNGRVGGDGDPPEAWSIISVSEVVCLSLHPSTN